MEPDSAAQPGQDAAKLLAQAEQAAQSSVDSTEAPWPILFALAVAIAAVFSLRGVIDSALWYWSILLAVPPLLWFCFWTRKRPKPRPALQHSGKYMLGFVLLMLTMPVSTFWVPHTWLFSGLKFLVLLAAFTSALGIMRRETIKSRVKDGNEQAR